MYSVKSNVIVKEPKAPPVEELLKAVVERLSQSGYTGEYAMNILQFNTMFVERDRGRLATFSEWVSAICEEFFANLKSSNNNWNAVSALLNRCGHSWNEIKEQKNVVDRTLRSKPK